MAKNNPTLKKSRSRVSQTDIPAFPLEQALRVATTIAENYASAPTKPLHVAAGLEIAPNSSQFKMLTGAAIAYGLTIGGYNAAEISLTEIGKRATKPLSEGDDLTALREALLKPRILNEFLNKYDNSPLPADKIAVNVLEDMGVPSERAITTYSLIVESAKQYGFTKEIKSKIYIDLSSINVLADEQADPNQTQEQLEDTEVLEADHTALVQRKDNSDETSHRDLKTSENRNVFITHGKNKAFIEPIKKLLAFGELQPVVSVEKQSVSQPVPDKVMGDMRKCSAAIIHVEQEQKLIDSDANEVIVINLNVLIEIGAAMALYGRRFILLVREGVKLPSNLQGLYEVRYNGDTLDGDATIKLLEAMKDIKNNPLPSFSE